MIKTKRNNGTVLIRFESPKEMFDFIRTGRDIYSSGLEKYIFLYAEYDSICEYSIGEQEAEELKATKGCWSGHLGKGGRIYDNESPMTAYELCESCWEDTEWENVSGFDWFIRSWTKEEITGFIKNNCYLETGAHASLKELCISEEDADDEDMRDWNEMSYVVPKKWLKQKVMEMHGSDLKSFLCNHTSKESEDIFLEAIRDRQVVMADFD